MGKMSFEAKLTRKASLVSLMLLYFLHDASQCMKSCRSNLHYANAFYILIAKPHKVPHLKLLLSNTKKFVFRLVPRSLFKAFSQLVIILKSPGCILVCLPTTTWEVSHNEANTKLEQASSLVALWNEKLQPDKPCFGFLFFYLDFIFHFSLFVISLFYNINMDI